ncbi:tetratricopeptide repeat protein, partial [Bacillus sp. SIMBA_033]|uniref:tetratricopeptide repeat protein n=1 Tax=Bacillus sp. SIMBA_033 TaxID=3085776 RepID=UPI00397AEF08
EGSSQRLTRLSEYYAHFFEGMYFFAKGLYIQAIQSYKQAEKKIYHVRDQVEKAEFYFKMAQVFYHMKQTHVSMSYVTQAYNIYDKQETYTIRKIQCLFVIAGNYTDMQMHEKALPHMKSCLATARIIGNKLIMAKALRNMGLCHVKMNDFDSAADCFLESAKIS